MNPTGPSGPRSVITATRAGWLRKTALNRSALIASGDMPGSAAGRGSRSPRSPAPGQRRPPRTRRPSYLPCSSCRSPFQRRRRVQNSCRSFLHDVPSYLRHRQRHSPTRVRPGRGGDGCLTQRARGVVPRYRQCRRASTRRAPGRVRSRRWRRRCALEGFRRRVVRHPQATARRPRRAVAKSIDRTGFSTLRVHSARTTLASRP